MRVSKSNTETYVITEVPGLDPITVFISNHRRGSGRMVVEHFGDAWAHYWIAMGDRTVQQFVAGAGLDYLLRKLCRETKQTDFDAINRIAQEKGIELDVTTDVEVAFAAEDMELIFGEDWYLDMPRRHSNEYLELRKVLTIVRAAFDEELSDEAAA